MRALLAASPQAGRLLRPLWRKLTTDPLPEPLRLPPKRPRSEQPIVARPQQARPPDVTTRRRPAIAAGPPGLPPWPPPLWPD